MAKKKLSAVNYLVPYQAQPDAQTVDERFIFGVKRTAEGGYRLYNHADEVRIPNRKIVVGGSYFFELHVPVMLPFSEISDHLSNLEVRIISVFVDSMDE